MHPQAAFGGPAEPCAQRRLAPPGAVSYTPAIGATKSGDKARNGGYDDTNNDGGSAEI